MMYQPKAIRKLQIFSKFVLVLLGTILGIGCSSTECITVDPVVASSPWIGPNERALTQICRVQRFLTESAYHYVIWKNTGGRQFDSRKITARAEAFLENTGNERNHLIDELPLPPFGIFVENREISRKVPVVEPAWMIISVDPLVLIKTRGKVQYLLSQGEASSVYSITGWKGVPKVYILLPRGFAFGTQLIFTEDAEWFSPDMGVAPQLLDNVYVGQGTYRIPVSWGAIVLRHEGDELLVSTEEEKKL